jgi:uncharacterized protein (DUF885 family)
LRRPNHRRRAFDEAHVTDFRARIDRFLEEYLERNPVAATVIGDHRFDDRWPDLSAAGRGERLAFAERWLEELRGLSDLSTEDAIDRDLLVMELEAARFDDTTLREEAWNPLEWVYLLGGGLFPLIAREFAPLAVRLGSVAGRLERIGAVVNAAIEELGSLPDRPVGRFQAEKGLEQLPGIIELAEEAVAAAEAAPDDPAVAVVLPRLRAATETARSGLDHFERHLRDVVLPASEGEARLGPKLFAEKMRHTMRSDALTPERILAQAETEFGAVRAEMVRIAADLWATWRPDEPRPNDEQHLVRGVLDAIAADHPSGEGLIEFCREELTRIEAFCREHDVIGLADEPLDIRWTPTFMRAFGGAMLDSPGPLDRGEKAFFSITPVNESWSPERQESYLREDNARMLRLLTIHEAVPGHYLQGVYANRVDSIVRTIFGSGLFAEGWAVYVTQVMMDLGYGADDPALLLTHWKFYLRSITNAIIDARIHVHGMTEEEAVSLMVEGGFQEEGEARAKYDRARLSSTQLSTYFTGSMEFWDIERAVRRRAAVMAGASTEDVPEPRVVGGFGDTPGFEYRPHLENVISHGAPPTSLLRRIVLG